jgi:enterobactin synthetase component D
MRSVAAEIAFDRTLEHGRCVGVRIPGAEPAVDALAETSLAPAERTRAMSLPFLRRRTWVGGRVAMREALERLRLPLLAIATDDRGAPILPSGAAGSISHKESLAVALVAQEPYAKVGVDIEMDVPRSQDISSRVLTDDEIAELASLDPASLAREVLLRFSAKEAIYKALDPFVRRYVGFKEVGVSTRPDGTARVSIHLERAEGPFAIDVRWLRFDGIVLTTARVSPR